MQNTPFEIHWKMPFFDRQCSHFSIAVRSWSGTLPAFWGLNSRQSPMAHGPWATGGNLSPKTRAVSLTRNVLQSKSGCIADRKMAFSSEFQKVYFAFQKCVFSIFELNFTRINE